MSKILKPGEKVTLPDGRIITFLQTCSPECDGCAFEYENCGLYESYLGPCGSGRTDGKIGIYVECKKQEV